MTQSFKSTDLVFLSNNSIYASVVLDTICTQELCPKAVVLPYFGGPDKGSGPFDVAQADSVSTTEFLCQKCTIPIIYSPKTQIKALENYLKTNPTDYLIVACWPYLIPRGVINAVTHRAMNLHPSRLPAFAGFDPFNAQISQKVSTSGVTLHELNDVFDQGDHLQQSQFNVNWESIGNVALRDNFERFMALKAAELLLSYLKSFS